MSLIETQNLTKIYGSGETAVTALDHVNLKVNAGEFVAVMGPSGCGKSTLLHLLISQNRLGEETERRADLDLHIGLLTEHELTRVLQMLDAIQDKPGIVDHANSELADLEMETRPEDVLAEIHRLQAIELSQR
ncbi:MAG: ATP-binding cassette domain-containing protein [Chloroflexi bacterium]|nr:ATP-binding cassette domain-containing protein [Chloroflexota bacterium]